MRSERVSRRAEELSRMRCDVQVLCSTIASLALNWFIETNTDNELNAGWGLAGAVVQKSIVHRKARRFIKETHWTGTTFFRTSIISHTFTRFSRFFLGSVGKFALWGSFSVQEGGGLSRRNARGLLSKLGGSRMKGAAKLMHNSHLEMMRGINLQIWGLDRFRKMTHAASSTASSDPDPFN